MYLSLHPFGLNREVLGRQGGLKVFNCFAGTQYSEKMCHNIQGYVVLILIILWLEYLYSVHRWDV
jgi:hypothetical protein